MAKENINFSHDEDLGGAQSFSGTTWTAAVLVSQTSGVAVQVPLTAGRFGGTEYDKKYPNVLHCCSSKVMDMYEMPRPQDEETDTSTETTN